MEKDYSTSRTFTIKLSTLYKLIDLSNKSGKALNSYVREVLEKHVHTAGK